MSAPSKLDTIHQSLSDGKIDQREALEDAYKAALDDAKKVMCDFCNDGDPDQVKGSTLGHSSMGRWYPCGARAIRSLADGGQK